MLDVAAKTEIGAVSLQQDRVGPRQGKRLNGCPESSDQVRGDSISGFRTRKHQPSHAI